METIKKWIDLRLNLSHLLIIFFAALSGLALWRNSAVANVEVVARVKAVEIETTRHEATVSSITDRLQTIDKNQGVVAAMLTEHLRTHPKP